MAEKGGYAHFMLKEIHEQPQAVADTMRGRVVLETGCGRPSGGQPHRRAGRPSAARLPRLLRHLVPRGADRPLHGRAARRAPRRGGSRLRVPLPGRGARARDAGRRHLAVGRDRRHARRRQGARATGARRCWPSPTWWAPPSRARADGVIYTHAGPEIGVASTKTFTATITAAYLLALALGLRRGLPDVPRRPEASRRSWLELPALMAQALDRAGGGGGARHRAGRARQLPLPGPRPAPPRSRSKGPSSSRRSPTSTPRAMPPAR